MISEVYICLEFTQPACMKVYYFIFIQILFVEVSFAQHSHILIKNGVGKYSIVLPVNTTEADEDAARILQSTLDSIANVSLPIVTWSKKRKKHCIFINSFTDNDINSTRQILQPDGFYIYTDKNNMYIRSGKKRGAVFAVVHLLEKYLNCKYYSPNYRVFPKRHLVDLPAIKDFQNPDNTLRFVNGRMTQNHKDYRDWQKLNNHQGEFAVGYFVHTFHKLVPAEDYFEKHPEYFSMVNGKRTRDQLCMTNPNVRSLVIRKIRAEMAIQPDKNLWSVSQNDNPFYCQCDGCMQILREEGAASGPLVHFVNEVADHFPDKEISTLAYQFSRQAPGIIKPRKNVQIMLCTIELNRSKEIENDPSSAAFVSDIKNWAAISDHIFLWDYTVDFAHHITPFPNIHVLQPNIRFFHNNGIKIHFQQTNTDIGYEFSELKSYLISRILWKTEIKVDSLIDDFLSGFYGLAGKYLKQYVEHMTSELLKSGDKLDIYGHPTAHSNSFLSAKNIEIYNQWFDAAEKSVAESPLYLNHVQMARLPLKYAMMEIGKAEMFGKRGFYSKNENNLVLKKEMADLLPEFMEVCYKNQVVAVNESGLTPDAYIKSSERTLEIKMKGNAAFEKKAKMTPAASEKYSHGNPELLTNGVNGSNDFRVHWLGWEGKDFELDIDLEKACDPESIQISSLYLPNSWIIHPSVINCKISFDGINYTDAGSVTVAGDQKKEDVNKVFTFDQNLKTCRYIKISVTSSKSLPAWHPAAGGTAWTFIDEIVVIEKN